MKRINKILFLLLILFSTVFSLHAQNMDSLKQVLKLAKHDSIRCNILNIMIEAEGDDAIWPGYNDQMQVICEKNLKSITTKDPLYPFYTKHLAAVYNNKSYLAGRMNQADGALEYSIKSYEVYEGLLKNTKEEALKKELTISIATALNNIGSAYRLKGDMQKTIEYLEKGLKIQETIGDKEGLARSLSNLAFIYDLQGDIPRSLEYNHKSLKIKKGINDKDGMGYSFNNIGALYMAQGDLDIALNYFAESRKIQEEIGDKNGLARSLNNIGYVYADKNKTDLALEYYNKSLKIRESIQDKQGIAEVNNNIGCVYQRLAETKNNASQTNDSLTNTALHYFHKSLSTQEEIGDKRGIANSLNNIAEIWVLRGEFQKAKGYAEKGFKISKELGYPDHLKQSSLILSKIYQKEGNYKDAFQMQVLYKQMADSLNNENTKKASIQKSFQYEYDKKAAADSVKVFEERKLFDAQIKQERTQRTALYVGIGLIGIFSIFMYNRFRVTRKQKGIIESQKAEVDKQRELADSRRIIAEEQRHVIQEKQTEILDSIHYASRIQRAMLTSEEYISHHFPAEYFIFYQPKDIVSGDFHWALSHHNKFYISTSDCTGHGVPGAFMSLLNINFLNENVIEKSIEDPAKILDEQKKGIIKALNPKGDENSKDGMDSVLCAFDLQNMKLNFAAGNNPLWLIRNKELIEFKADKMAVGMGEDNAKDFTSQSIDLQKGDIIYTFTDGYADQFGGPKGKKFLYKQFHSILLDNHHLAMNEQRDILEKRINEWMVNTEQIDDLLVIGVRV